MDHYSRSEDFNNVKLNQYIIKAPVTSRINQNSSILNLYAVLNSRVLFSPNPTHMHKWISINTE